MPLALSAEDLGPQIGGDPTSLELAASTWAAAASELDASNQKWLSAIVPLRQGPVPWTGDGANSFFDAAGVLSLSLSNMGGVLDQAAATVKGFAVQLRDAQAQADRYAMAVRESINESLALERRINDCLTGPLPDPASAAIARQRLDACLSDSDRTSQRWAALATSIDQAVQATAQHIESILAQLEPIAFDTGFAANPDLPASADDAPVTTSWVRLNGPLWGANGPSPADVGQTVLGDCYFLASVAALARSNPSLVQRMIHANPDGTYTVQFGDGSRVTVDSTVPLDTTRYGSYEDTTAWGAGTPTWAAILEKAYAVRQGGDYNAIANGGLATNVLPELAGPAYRSVAAPPNTGDTTLVQALVPYAQQHNIPAVVGTWDPNADNAPSNATDILTQYHLVGGHAYYVTGYDPSTGLVHLGNPWGTTAADTPKPIPLTQLDGVTNDISLANGLGASA